MAEALMTEDRVLNTEEAGKFCALAPGTMENWRAAGQGPSYVRLGRHRVGYRIADLRQWLEANAVTPGAEITNPDEV